MANVVTLTELERARAGAIAARRAYVSELERRQALELQIAVGGIAEAEHRLMSGVAERSGLKTAEGAVLFADRIEFQASDEEGDKNVKPKPQPAKAK